jgi:hypothetical protein
MIYRFILMLAILTAWSTMPAQSQSELDTLETEYKSVSSRLQKHIVDEAWIDDDVRSPDLLARQWHLAGEFIAAWLNAHDSEGLGSVKAALDRLAPGIKPEYLKLGEDSILIVAPGAIGNVFLLAKSGGRYRSTWSTADVQTAHGEQVKILAAWRPENARYLAASGSAGPVIPSLGKLPADANGHPRFYIDGDHAQLAGGTIGAQISVWLWNGTTANLQIARTYTKMIEQAVGTRVEANLLKVRQKKFFRSFFSCGMCEERQTDWIVKLTPEGGCN